MSLGAVPTDFTFTNKRRHRGERERETERASLEVSGVERQVEWKSVERKKRLQHLPSSLSFLPSAFPPSFLCWLKRGRRRGERKGSFKNLLKNKLLVKRKKRKEKKCWGTSSQAPLNS